MSFYLLIARYIFLTSVFDVLAPASFDVRSELSIEEQLKLLEDIAYEERKRIQNCNLKIAAELSPTILPNAYQKTINVTFKLNDYFKNCFSHFKIILKKEIRKVFKEVDDGLIEYNYDVKKEGFYLFKNITCGLYEVSIIPFYTRLNRSNKFQTLDKRFNVSTIDCSGILQNPVSRSEDLMNTVVLILSLCAVIVILIVGGLTYYQYTSALKSRKEKVQCVEVGKPLMSSNHLSKEIEVFIIYHYDNTTKEKVKRLIDFLSLVPNLKVSVIGDYLSVKLMNNVWIINKLKRTNEDNIIKKLILVDSEVKDGDSDENYNEKDDFFLAVTMLTQLWTEYFDDYNNMFIVHFGDCFTEFKNLECIVANVRYRIPDHLEPLCQTLLFGSQINPTLIDISRY